MVDQLEGRDLGDTVSHQSGNNVSSRAENPGRAHAEGKKYEDHPRKFRESVRNFQLTSGDPFRTLNRWERQLDGGF